MKTHFMAGNSYEGCEHEHRSAKAAEQCANKANKSLGRYGTRYRVWLIWYEGKRRRWKLIPNK